MTLSKPNHPRKGQITRVEPIRDLNAIDEIKKFLRKTPRDFDIFTIGINTNLRAVDLLRLTVGQIRYLVVGDHLVISEKKTGKIRRATINRTVFEALQSWLVAY